MYRVNERKVQIRAFVGILSLIFFAEMLVMWTLSWFSIESTLVEVLIDSTLLTLIVAPAIYYLLNNRLVTFNRQLFDELKQQVDNLDIAALVSETDLDGYITYVNSKFCDVSGYTKKELIGKTHQIINSKYHSSEFWREMWSTILSGNVWKGEVRNRTKQGDYYWVESTVFPKLDKNGNMIGFVSIRLDITEQKQTKEQLKHAVKKAEELTKAKSLFLATMSHEIRTPMNGVIAMTELLERTELNKEQSSMLSTIKTSGNSLLIIINDILDFSKMEAGKLELDLHEFSLSNLIDNLISLYSSQASKKGIIIDVNVSDITHDILVGDSTRIIQILSNFLSNAIKFTGENGKVEFSLIEANIDENSVGLTFSIKDDGIGISKEQQKKLFKDFSQADSSTTRNYGGTGLGLAICSKLADLMNASIHIESELNFGTKASLLLELEKASEDNVISEKQFTNSIKDEEFALMYPHNIIVAEDNAVNKTIAKMMFKALGYECEIVNNGVELVDACTSKEGTKYSIVFTDIMMPLLDGISATKQIKYCLRDNSPPIIAMTANVYDSDQASYREAGMDGFIPKPININAIKEVLSQYPNS
jgi:PAS domain S-box-containing protein